MKKVVLNLVFVFISSLAIAGGGKNSKVVEGIILDDEGNPAIGAKVILVETQQEVYTDFEGAFKFENVSASAHKLKVNYISHQELVTELSTQTTLNNTLELYLESQ